MRGAHRRGCAASGRMPDVEEPITYEIMADDTIAFMDAIGHRAGPRGGLERRRQCRHDHGDAAAVPRTQTGPYRDGRERERW